MIRLPVALSVPVVAAAPAAARMAQPACPTLSDAHLPVDPAASTGAPRAVAAAASGAGAPIPPGVPAAVRLHPAAAVSFAVAPGEVCTPADPHAGIVEVELPEAGTRRVPAPTGLRIDVVGPVRGGPVDRVRRACARHQRREDERVPARRRAAHPPALRQPRPRNPGHGQRQALKARSARPGVPPGGA